MRKWFVAMCKSAQESVAKSHLRQQGFGVYLPQLRTQRQVGTRMVDVVEPLFPRYIFVQFDPARKSSSPIRATRGILSLVRFGGILAEVPRKVIDFLKLREGSDGLHTDSRIGLTPGDQVELLEGPFAGMTAVFMERSGHRRVSLLLNVFDQRVVVPRGIVRKVE